MPRIKPRPLFGLDESFPFARFVGLLCLNFGGFQVGFLGARFCC